TPRDAFRAQADGVVTLAFAPDGRALATGGWDRTIAVWAVPRAGGPAVLRGHETAVTGLAFAPDGRALASASSDGTVLLWDVAAGRALKTLRIRAGLHHGAIALAWAP